MSDKKRRRLTTDEKIGIIQQIESGKRISALVAQTGVLRAAEDSADIFSVWQNRPMEGCFDANSGQIDCRDSCTHMMRYGYVQESAGNSPNPKKMGINTKREWQDLRLAKK